MSQLSTFRQLQRFENPTQPHHMTAENGVMNWLRTNIKQRDLIVVVGFCAIGLMLTFAVMAQVPDFPTGEITLLP
jgi:hypothetical protein